MLSMSKFINAKPEKINSKKLKVYSTKTVIGDVAYMIIFAI